MSKTSVVCRVFVYAFLAVAVTAATSPAGDYDGLPTVGGDPAFATTADAMATTIESFIDAQDFDAAEASALELTKSYPKFMKGWLLLGFCQSRTGKFTESNESYDQALWLGADKRTVLTRKAYNFLRLGKIDKAKSCYRTILESDYDDTEALQQLGYIEGKLGNYDEAVHFYRRVLVSDPENTDVIQALAKLEARRGGNGEVKALLERALEIDPDDKETLGRLGLFYIKEKNFSAAVTPLERLVALDPENARARRNLGVAYYQLGEKKKAGREFEKVRELGGDMAGLYGPLADCYTEAGSRTDALNVIRQGLESDEQKAWLYCMWGKILEKSGDYDGAIAKFSHAAQLQEEPWSSYAKKEMGRQAKLKKRAELMSSQQGMH